MKWEKLGVIDVSGRCEWMMSHAQNPFAELVNGSIYKIHFAPRDKFNRARGGWVVIDIKDPLKILEISKSPSIDLGKLGCFDDCGVMPSCITEYEGKQFMYYTGWSKAVVTPFTFYIGLLISSDDELHYERYSLAPVLGRSYHDPYLTASPWVLRDGDVWMMWYVSCVKWDFVDGEPKPKHYYHIKYAESKDGLVWDNSGIVCIDFKKDEYAIARPTVRKEDGIYKMWYCYRGGTGTYRAGYAESYDGKEWEREDHTVGIDVSEKGWDSEMLCYPCVLKHGDAEFLLYNGNDFGRTGFGIARRIK